jgi:GH43 family beta-xylosidase
VGDLDTGANGLIAMPHVDVNEGPEILTHGNRIFLIYSASGCWTNYYELGMLTATTGSDLLNPASWVKSDQAVFRESPLAQAFGTGHNTFFTSPDGTEQWILYHANSAANQGCGNHRSPRAQRFTWNADGTPNFGEPIPLGTPIAKPSATPAH